MAQRSPQQEVPRSSTDERRECFLRTLPEIERIIGKTWYHYGLRGSGEEDFASHIKLKLIEDDYAILGRFRAESQLSTYLTRVIRNLGRDYLHQCHGRWRPSAEARRLGVEAVLLERLLFVERRDSGEAIEMVASQEGCSLSRQELGEMAHRLPVRFVRRFLGEEYLAGMATDHGTEWRVETQEKRRILRRIYHALREALHSLAEEELRILRLQYHEGLNLTEVAHRLDLPRRRVYTVRDRSLRQMRRIFEQWGISPEEIERILGGGAMQVQIDFQHRAVRAV